MFHGDAGRSWTADLVQSEPVVAVEEYASVLTGLVLCVALKMGGGAVGLAVREALEGPVADRNCIHKLFYPIELLNLGNCWFQFSDLNCFVGIFAFSLENRLNRDHALPFVKVGAQHPARCLAHFRADPRPIRLCINQDLGAFGYSGER